MAARMVEAACVSVISPVGRIRRAEQRGADADDDGQHHQLDAGGDDVAEHAFGQEGGLAEQGERHQHEARQHRQLELDDGDEELDGQDEEGQQHDQPGQHQHGDGDEVGEEVVMPISSPAFSSSGRDAAKPVPPTKPGRIRSCAVNRGAAGFQAEPGEGGKTMSARPLKLLSSSAKKPT